MKKSDVALIILIASISLVIAYFVMGAVFGKSSEQEAEIQTINPIGSQMVQPSPKIFNQDAINPTVTVVIGSDAVEQ